MNYMQIPVKVILNDYAKHQQKNFFDDVKTEMKCKYCGTELRIAELNDNACSDCIYYYEK